MLKTYSQYAKNFDDSCYGWTNNQKYNFMYLKSIENHCNNLLCTRGYLFLRDVYEMLGIHITKESCIVGWIYEEHNTIGDNYVKFMYEENEKSNSICIDFNVDGDIIDRI